MVLKESYFNEKELRNYSIELFNKISNFDFEDLNEKKIFKLKSEVIKAFNFTKVPSNIEIISSLGINERKRYKKYLELLNTKPSRNLSGVTVVAIMSEPKKCPHTCDYCPGGSNSIFGDVPQSYTGNEPASMRAKRNAYDSYLQVMTRLHQYVLLNSNFSKIDLIIMGGTFISYSLDYQKEFIKYSYKAMNDFGYLFGNDLANFDFNLFFSIFDKNIHEDRKIRSKLYLLRFIDLEKFDNNKKNIELKLNSLFKTFILENKQIVENIEKLEFEDNIAKLNILKSKITKNIILFLKNHNIAIYNKTIADEKDRNEYAKVRCIGINFETRPDYGKLKDLVLMQTFGATKLELGIQSTDDKTLDYVNRGHLVKDSIESIALARDLGFKLTLHYMPGLPQKINNNILDNVQRDIKGLNDIVLNPDYMADMVKIYPTIVVRGTKLYDDFITGRYEPLNIENTVKIITEFMKFVPKWVRVMRIQRDIPTTFIDAGPKYSNLRQLVDKRIEEENIDCKDIRYKEISRVLNRELSFSQDKNKKNQLIKELNSDSNFILNRVDYIASNGKEIFLTIEHKNLNAIAGFLRLRILPRALRKEITNNSAMIRELHVYGDSTNVGLKGILQHRGFGKRLMREAENISKNEFNCDKILVISGVGVREYYYKLGYKKDGVYVSKILN